MKIKYFLLLSIIMLSCKDDISNKKFRNENYVFYQENGKAGEWLKINPELEIKLPKSFSTYFFPNRSRYAELEVIDSFPNRIIRFFDQEDKLIRTTKFESDSVVSSIFENGYYKEYHSNLGLLQSEGLVKNNMSQGKWKFYRNDGQTIKQIVEYVNDTLHGIREDYWENGNLKVKTANVYGRKNDESFHYYETGELEEKNFLKNGKLHGPMTKFYKNGKIKSERNYWNEKLIDSCTTYYESGQIRIIQIFNLDTVTLESNGKQINYYPSGNLKARATFEGEKAKMTLFYENGIISQKTEKLNNKHHGKTIAYHENGQKWLEGVFVENMYNGSFKFYSESGKLIKTVNYDYDQPIDSIMH